MKRLYIDMPALLESTVSAETIDCEYLFHRRNQGPLSVLEIAEFAAYCRQCTDSFCVTACPVEALERLENGSIKRWNMRCVGCKSCILACPFGTILPEVINYITSHCDHCLNQLAKDPDYQPVCVQTAPPETFSIKDVKAEDPDNQIWFCGEHMAIKSPSWRHKEGLV